VRERERERDQYGFSSPALRGVQQKIKQEQQEESLKPAKNTRT
jgi:hypothetical protein